ncbi:MAG: pyridoxal-phosphate dependent enzyme [Candidatus Eisenbacteria bacterium]
MNDKIPDPPEVEAPPEAVPPGSQLSDPILDGATPQERTYSPDLKDAVEIARDRTRDVEERLEAYEDLFDSEVGDTSLTRARNIEREVGLRQLYLKFEGGNPTGTQKDRIAFAQAMDALRRGYDAVTVATCGNYGAAVALAASLAGLECLIYIPETYHTKRVEEMVKLGGTIVRVPGDYEAAVVASRERAERDEVYDANPGGANTALQLRSYGEIAYEIYDELRDAPAVVAAPVSNGTTLAGIYKGFLSLNRRGKTSRIPKIVAGSTFGKNPITRAFAKGLDTCEDLVPERVKETSVNEPLVNWHSIDGDPALDAIRTTGGWAANASDKSMLSYSKFIREREGLNTLPASTAGLIALLDRHQKEALGNDRYVIVLTGKR